MTAWSPQQNEALSTAGAWMRMKYSPTFYLAGYAGTGKTTLAMHLAEHARGEVAFAAFTGKASRVMRNKGCADAKTIHSLIYNAETNIETGEVTLTLKSRAELDNYSLVIVDEVSMVNEELGKDLLSFGIPVLVLGDPAQLPPPNGAGYFTRRDPDYMLTEVHRQAADSPVLKLATAIRQGEWNRAEVDGPNLSVVRKSGFDRSVATNADIVLVGRNDTRRCFNDWIRKKAGIAAGAMPQKGEPVICLKNDRQVRINNGDLFRVEAVKSKRGKTIRLELFDAETGAQRSVTVPREFFLNDAKAAEMPYRDLMNKQQFTFGYAITCHKSQGSQWPHVCVFDESEAFREDGQRWLYTAVTRASEKLTLVLREKRS
ncbi:PIF1 helicase [uncultured Pleomorphomonas sp.]|uniref:PIF1 helicase n=1 Tax=uncultured Pleomorphomonas sp. TaxID=442121 RepID=A0A212LQE6_9HYPH|nr:AAA family ATPase [uncultured Pleomorphomonas sp.]SCM79808.1 PIF1 helicase [uncultured Pleomorphomonas sp.]